MLVVEVAESSLAFDRDYKGSLYARAGVPDYWVLQGTFLVVSAAVIAATLAANLLYGLLDPRVRT